MKINELNRTPGYAVSGGIGVFVVDKCISSAVAEDGRHAQAWVQMPKLRTITVDQPTGVPPSSYERCP